MSSSGAYPLLCAPLLKTKVWGGRNLETLFGMALPAEEAIGEAWVAADLAEGESQIANGPLAGQFLSEAARLWGENLIGSAWRGRPTGGRFPLLVKLLDAEKDLSIQVHPDDEACRAHFPDDFSKDESWIILAARPGGAILHGFKAGVTLDDFDRLLAEKRVTDCIRRIEVHPGEFYRVAPGTIHAIRGGVTLLEIQEPSDSTFRVYDYDRPGLDGKPRPLHLDAARKVMRFGKDLPSQPKPDTTLAKWGKRTLLADVPAYRIERLDIEAEISWTVDQRSAQVLIILGGTASLEAAGESLELGAGSCVILPAAIRKARLIPGESKTHVVLAGAGGAALCQPRR